MGISIRPRAKLQITWLKAAGVKIPYTVGTMVELPRAVLLADEIAEVAEFFSFGTNDLTQTVMGSRATTRDASSRLVDEKKAGIFPAIRSDARHQGGVGMMVRMGIEKGRKRVQN